MTDEEYQLASLRMLGSISATQQVMKRSIERLEAAVLGNPEEGVNGLLTRTAVLETSVMSKVKQGTIVAGGGGLGAILALLLPFLRDLLSNV